MNHMLNSSMPVSDINSAIRRSIRRLEDISRTLYAAEHAAVLEIARELHALERDTPSREPEAFETPNLDAFGYATVLGYLNVEAPWFLMNMEDPVRDTIVLGQRVSRFCARNGVKVVRVEACEHVKARYAKVTHVNAYPTHVLNAVLFEGAR
jgi:hypothetical protein